jgi:hypothetical protein
MLWNTGVFSNSEERLDDFPLCLDGWNIEMFEVSRHWWASGWKDLIVRTDVADWWASGWNTTSSGRLTGKQNKSLKTSQNLLEEHSWRVSLWKQQHYIEVILSNRMQPTQKLTLGITSPFLFGSTHFEFVFVSPMVSIQLCCKYFDDNKFYLVALMYWLQVW